MIDIQGTFTLDRLADMLFDEEEKNVDEREESNKSKESVGNER